MAQILIDNLNYRHSNNNGGTHSRQPKIIRTCNCFKFSVNDYYLKFYLLLDPRIHQNLAGGMQPRRSKVNDIVSREKRSISVNQE